MDDATKSMSILGVQCFEIARQAAEKARDKANTELLVRFKSFLNARVLSLADHGVQVLRSHDDPIAQSIQRAIYQSRIDEALLIKKSLADIERRMTYDLPEV